MKFLLKIRRTSETEVMQRGYPRRATVELINAFLKDGYLRLAGSGTFELTDLGAAVLLDIAKENQRAFPESGDTI